MTDNATESRRSAVRPFVTYAYTGTFVAAATGALAVFLWQGETELAMGVLGIIGTAAAKTDGFWFGSRRPAEPRKEE